MQQGFDFQTAESAFDAVNAIRALEEAVKNCGFEQSLIVLVKMRASQINGCACRIHSHIRNTRLHGVTEERLRVLHAWRDPAMPFSARERAALAWTEALTPCCPPGTWPMPSTSKPGNNSIATNSPS